MNILGLFDVTRKKAMEPQTLPTNQLFKTLLQNIGFGTPLTDVKNLSDTINNGYMYNYIVYSVVNRIINSCSGVPWNYYIEKNKNSRAKYNRAILNKDLDTAIYLKESQFEIDNNSQAAQLLLKPNSYERINDIVTNTIAFYEITGNGFLYGIRRLSGGKEVIEMHQMPAHLVKIVFGTYFNPIKGYILDGYIRDEIAAENVMHIKNFNPDYSQQGSWLYGLSPIQSSAKLLTLSNNSIQTQISQYQNYGARGILTGAQNTNWTGEQVNEVKKIWDSKKGDNSKGDIIVTGEEMRWLQIGLSPVDLNIIESNKLTLRDLCSIYNVPSQLLGDSEHATYSNIKEARKALITDASLPVMEKVKDGFNRFLLSPDDKGIIDYDLSAFIELQDDMAAMATTLNTMWWLTPNEKRIASAKQPINMPVMDEVLIPMGTIPASEYMGSDDSAIDDLNNDDNSL